MVQVGFQGANVVLVNWPCNVRLADKDSVDQVQCPGRHVDLHVHRDRQSAQVQTSLSSFFPCLVLSDLTPSVWFAILWFVIRFTLTCSFTQINGLPISNRVFE